LDKGNLAFLLVISYNNANNQKEPPWNAQSKTPSRWSRTC
jgi:hypothetical protein